VPKCEIFGLLISHDFYTKKPLGEGDFRIVIKMQRLFVLDMISKFVLRKF
jgi:hypothetical protein